MRTGLEHGEAQQERAAVGAEAREPQQLGGRARGAPCPPQPSPAGYKSVEWIGCRAAGQLVGVVAGSCIRAARSQSHAPADHAPGSWPASNKATSLLACFQMRLTLSSQPRSRRCPPKPPPTQNRRTAKACAAASGHTSGTKGWAAGCERGRRRGGWEQRERRGAAGAAGLPRGWLAMHAMHARKAAANGRTSKVRGDTGVPHRPHARVDQQQQRHLTREVDHLLQPGCLPRGRICGGRRRLEG